MNFGIEFFVSQGWSNVEIRVDPGDCLRQAHVNSWGTDLQSWGSNPTQSTARGCSNLGRFLEGLNQPKKWGNYQTNPNRLMTICL
jgi:hypothetical protein